MLFPMPAYRFKSHRCMPSNSTYNFDIDKFDNFQYSRVIVSGQATG